MRGVCVVVVGSTNMPNPLVRGLAPDSSSLGYSQIQQPRVDYCVLILIKYGVNSL